MSRAQVEGVPPLIISGIYDPTWFWLLAALSHLCAGGQSDRRLTLGSGGSKKSALHAKNCLYGRGEGADYHNPPCSQLVNR